MRGGEQQAQPRGHAPRPHVRAPLDDVLLAKGALHHALRVQVHPLVPQRVAAAPATPPLVRQQRAALRRQYAAALLLPSPQGPRVGARRVGRLVCVWAGGSGRAGARGVTGRSQVHPHNASHRRRTCQPPAAAPHAPRSPPSRAPANTAAISAGSTPISCSSTSRISPSGRKSSGSSRSSAAGMRSLRVRVDRRVGDRRVKAFAAAGGRSGRRAHSVGAQAFTRTATPRARSPPGVEQLSVDARQVIGGVAAAGL